MGFFDRPLFEPEPLRSPPVWMKPEAVLPGAVASQILVACTDDAAIWVSGLGAYPTGFEFNLSGVLRQPDSSERGRTVYSIRHRPDLGTGPLMSEYICVGVQFSDGRVATNVDWPLRGSEVLPAGPILISTGGGGGGRRYDMGYWVWPLPPPGPMTFICQWSQHGIGESHAHIDAGVILEAAARSISLWPEGQLDSP